MKQLIPFIIAIGIVGIGVGFLIYTSQQQGQTPSPQEEITNFQQCVDAGYAVMESYPRQCRTPDGQTFVENIGNELEKQNLIRVSNPRPNQTISSPLQVKGEARGFWFFEASFPIRLLDANGNEIPLDPPYIMTSSEWMTEDFVPFQATIEFDAPSTETGTLLLQRDNPSGLPENDDQVMIPIRFGSTSENGTSRAKDGCLITGCSGQICADEEVATTCEFRPEYACYREATCERQEDGECGWTQTEELTQCLSAAQ